MLLLNRLRCPHQAQLGWLPSQHRSYHKTTRGNRALPNDKGESDDVLEKAWDQIKDKLARSPDLNDEEKELLKKATVDDVTSSSFIKEAVSKQLGPLLESIGIEADPYSFFIDLLGLATFIQFISLGMLFYSAEGLGYDTGEAFRLSGGLLLGYLLRPLVKIEQFLQPVYNLLTKAIAGPNAEYVVERASDEAIQSTVSKLSIMIACGLLLPQLILHYSLRECLQLTGPATVGLVLFDVMYGAALLIKIDQAKR